MTNEEAALPTAPAYKEDDLVYVDPELKIVVGLVEWKADGKPKALPMKNPTAEIDEEPAEAPKGKSGRPVRPRRTRYYPWGTYRSMKKVYKLEGKPVREESHETLDSVIEKALKEPFWD